MAILLSDESMTLWAASWRWRRSHVGAGGDGFAVEQPACHLRRVRLKGKALHCTGVPRRRCFSGRFALGAPASQAAVRIVRKIREPSTEGCLRPSYVNSFWRRCRCTEIVAGISRPGVDAGGHRERTGGQAGKSPVGARSSGRGPILSRSPEAICDQRRAR